MELTGKAKIIGVEIQVTPTFKKRELVVVTDEQYPQSILIEFNQDKCDLLNSYKVGDNLKVLINIGGREWVNTQGETKYFNSIKGWRVEKLEGDSVTAPNAQPAGQVPELEDDLPF